MADDVSYLTKPKYTIVKLTNGSNGQWPCFEIANHLSRKKTSTVQPFSFYCFELNFRRYLKSPKNMSW